MKLNNETIRDAVKEWLNDDKLAKSKYGHISIWDTSEVTDMSGLFEAGDSFNQPIGDWDVSNVIYIKHSEPLGYTPSHEDYHSKENRYF
jgi:hypothetical protein|tara:strand:+ start:139 stop:405 length:267 start_codon:yes stop_codon:yes gene_type:complete